MRNLMFAVVLVVIGIAVVGYNRGWFAFATNGTDQKPGATVTVDKEKFHEDEQTAKNKVQGFEQAAKDKFGSPADKAKEPQRQP